MVHQWQWKDWANVLLPKKNNPVADAQAVTEWLRTNVTAILNPPEETDK